MESPSFQLSFRWKWISATRIRSMETAIIAAPNQLGTLIPGNLAANIHCLLFISADAAARVLFSPRTCHPPVGWGCVQVGTLAQLFSLLTANFRRKIADFVEETDEYTVGAGHRPARLFRKKISSNEKYCNNEAHPSPIRKWVGFAYCVSQKSG